MNSIIDRSGFLIVRIAGSKLSSTEQKFLKHPAVAGVILFRDNYEDRSQITELIEKLHSIKPGFIVSVDHECQIVQQFREEFTQLPLPVEIGRYYDEDKEAALKVAYAYGVVVGSEMREINVDLSYLPVLDIAHYGGVIGDRAFHKKPEVVKEIARSVINGLHNSSLPACAKHFPGHGSVPGDTHTDVIRDPRPMSEIEAHDLYPFSTLIKAKYLDCIMLSHIVYEAVSEMPASLSEHWIKNVLRESLGFDGLVCSDDLDMVGSGNTDSAVLKKAMDAGCDLLLLCRRDVGELRQLLSEFSSDEIDYYSRLSAKHLGAIDTHIYNRVPRGSKSYEDSVNKIKKLNSRADHKSQSQ